MDRTLISIDLETLDTTPTAVILEIGIVVGNDKGDVTERFQIFPDLKAQLASGRTISTDTVLWWMQQDATIINEQGGARRHTVGETLDHLNEFLAKHISKNTLVLGNAPSFDCDILGNFLGYKPWPFWVERDVRTARMAVPYAERAPNNAEHSGVADAMAQYLDFVTFLKKTDQ